MRHLWGGANSRLLRDEPLISPSKTLAPGLEDPKARQTEGLAQDVRLQRTFLPLSEVVGHPNPQSQPAEMACVQASPRTQASGSGTTPKGELPGKHYFKWKMSRDILLRHNNYPPIDRVGISCFNSGSKYRRPAKSRSVALPGVRIGTSSESEID